MDGIVPLIADRICPGCRSGSTHDDEHSVDLRRHGGRRAGPVSKSIHDGAELALLRDLYAHRTDRKAL
jgi:hypothetical protein